MIASNMISSKEFYIGYRLMREKFYFFGSFRETAKTIEDPLVRLEYLEAVMRHGLGDEEIELSPLVKSLMVQTRFTLDRSKEISDSASERWKRWWAPKGNKNAVKSFENISKQANSSKNKLNQAKTSEVEEEVEVEEEYKEIWDNKLSHKEIDDALDEFAKMRKQIKKPLTEKGKELIQNKLNKLYPNNTDLQIKCLYKSIENSWQGVFPLSEEDLNWYKPPTQKKFIPPDPNKVLSINELIW